MDDAMLMNAGLSTTGVAILLIAYRLFKSVQGKKLVSSCCGKKMEVGMDVVPMTPVPVKGACPPPQHLSIDVPNPLHSKAGLPRLETLGVPEPQGNPPI